MKRSRSYRILITIEAVDDDELQTAPSETTRVDAVEPQAVPTTPPLPELTSEHLRLLRLLFTLPTYADVQAETDIPYGTLRKHIKKLYEKMDVAGKSHAMALAREYFPNLDPAARHRRQVRH